MLLSSATFKLNKNKFASIWRGGEGDVGNIVIPRKIKCKNMCAVCFVVNLNLELSEWFMIKRKQQPSCPLRNLFKYPFCVRAFTVYSRSHSPSITMCTFRSVPFESLWIHFGIFQHEPKQKENKNFFFCFLIHFAIFSCVPALARRRTSLRFVMAKNNTTDDITTDENVERVLVNGVAEIKCDVSSSIDGDQVLLVVWYKNNLPIYR